MSNTTELAAQYWLGTSPTCDNRYFTSTAKFDHICMIFSLRVAERGSVSAVALRQVPVRRLDHMTLLVHELRSSSRARIIACL
jgi:hypothetical protein